MNSKSVFHVVNGDHQEGQLQHTSVNPDFIICRECLVEANVKGNFIGEVSN
jgi:hypothetical protein